jgi:hypothetical protein
MEMGEREREIKTGVQNFGFRTGYETNCLINKQRQIAGAKRGLARSRCRKRGGQRRKQEKCLQFGTVLKAQWHMSMWETESSRTWGKSCRLFKMPKLFILTFFIWLFLIFWIWLSGLFRVFKSTMPNLNYHASAFVVRIVYLYFN